eukprot:350555-Chlamydomonas_euryale.AAC.3
MKPHGRRLRCHRHDTAKLALQRREEGRQQGSVQPAPPHNHRQMQATGRFGVHCVLNAGNWKVWNVEWFECRQLDSLKCRNAARSPRRKPWAP